MTGTRTAPALAAATLCASVAVAASETPLQTFMGQMLGHLRTRSEACPEPVKDDRGVTPLCASYRASFSSFKLAWESNLRRYSLASLAHARGPWSYTGGQFVRVYEVEDQELTVSFDEKQGRIVLAHVELAAPPEETPQLQAEPPRIAGFGGVTTPTVVPSARVEPTYPSAAREARMEGTVALEVLVLRDGSVGRVTALRVDPPGWDFDKAALEAVGRWRFEPARAGSEAVDAVVPVYVEFELPE